MERNQNNSLSPCPCSPAGAGQSPVFGAEHVPPTEPEALARRQTGRGPKMRHMTKAATCTFLLVIAGCAGGKHEGPDAHAVRPSSQRALPLMEFPVQSHWAHSRIVLQMISADSGLLVVWALPAQIRQPVRAEVAPGTDWPEVLLYWGKDMAQYLAPSGSPRPPRLHERASSGTLLCMPTGERTASILLKDLRFQTVEIRQVGPVDVRLDLAPPP